MFKLRHQVPKFEQLRSVMLWPMKAKFEHVFLFVDTVPNYEQKWWFIKGCSNLGAAANFFKKNRFALKPSSNKEETCILNTKH